MMTFSVNIGLPTETTSYPIQDYLDDILLRLEDNQDNKNNPSSIANDIKIKTAIFWLESLQLQFIE